MIPFTSVLVATDFSASAQAAIEKGRALAGAFNAPLHILHVVTEPVDEVWPGYAPGARFVELVDQLQAEARKRLQEQESAENTASGRIVIATAWGDPADEILKYARGHGIDLVVCGTHGRRGLDHIAMGSVAERVVRLAACPVLTVHQSASLPSDSPVSL